jgi:GNAT superfamily N-acetyltransferase
MNDYALRAATTRDVAALSTLMEEFYLEDNQPFHRPKAEQAFRDLLSDRRFGRAWLIESGRQIAGYIILIFCFTLEFYGRAGYIDDFFIQKDSRGRGIGKKVLQDMEEFARQESLKVLFVGANDTLKPYLLNFYRAAGFAGRPYRVMSKGLES